MDCPNAVLTYQAALTASSPWALQILDASSTFPDGLLAAPGPRLGHFDQCLAASDAAPFPTNFCFVKFQSPPTTPLSWTKLGVALRANEPLPQVAVDLAVCVPAVCDAAAAVEVAALHLKPLMDKFGGSVQPSSCRQQIPIDAAAIAFFSVAILLCAVVLFSTLTDKLSWFSARRNLASLFASATPNTVHCVHGIRYLSICWIMFGHKFYYTSLSAPIPISESSAPSWASALLLNAYLGVDTFLLLAAFLSARGVARARRLPVLRFYALRWARLWGPLAAVVFFTACASSTVAQGPLWGTVVTEAQFCQKSWWSSLIFLNNIVNLNNPPCLSYSWYLSVDSQLAWLSPLVLIPLLRWRKIGIASAIVLLVSTIAAIFSLTLIYDLPWTLSIVSDTDKIGFFWLVIYTNPLLRCQPYLVGLLLGFFMEKPVKPLSKTLVIFAWITSLSLMSLSLFGLILSFNEALEENTIAAAIYGSLHRLTWSLGLSWIIFGCHKGYGGVIDKILSLKLWVPLSCLTYCIFLTHTAFLSMQTATQRAQTQFSAFQVVHGYLSDLALVLLPATALYLTVEAPVNGLIKSLLKQSKHRSV